MVAALNGKGITTTSGLVWEPNTWGMFWSSYGKDVNSLIAKPGTTEAAQATAQPAGDDTGAEIQDAGLLPAQPQEPTEPTGESFVIPEPTIDTSPREEDVTPAPTPVIPTNENVIPEQTRYVPLGTIELTEVRRMLEWWKDQGGDAASLPTPLGERPRFDRSNAVRGTVRLGKALYNEASKWAAKHRLETGGNFSGLVELLLWRHLGSDPKYLRPGQDEQPEHEEN
jgi:hypothetical protein